MGSWKMCLVSKWAIFHFHDYGRRGKRCTGHTSPLRCVKVSCVPFEGDIFDDFCQGEPLTRQGHHSLRCPCIYYSTLSSIIILSIILFRSTPHPVTVTTRIITFLVGNPYKPSFATVTGWGGDPTYYNQRVPARVAYQCLAP